MGSGEKADAFEQEEGELVVRVEASVAGKGQRPVKAAAEVFVRREQFRPAMFSCAKASIEALNSAICALCRKEKEEDAPAGEEGKGE